MFWAGYPLETLWADQVDLILMCRIPEKSTRLVARLELPSNGSQLRAESDYGDATTSAVASFVLRTMVMMAHTRISWIRTLAEHHRMGSMNSLGS